MTKLNDQFNELVKVTIEEKQALTENSNNKNDIQLEVMDESAKSPNFFCDNKSSSNKPEQKYTTTRIKSRNFLSNISYVWINKENYYNENFIFNIYLLATKSLNPFSLDRKINDQNKHQMIYVMERMYVASVLQAHLQRQKHCLS